MRKIILAVIVITALGYYAKVQFFAEKRILRIGVECDYPPNSWLEDTKSDTNLPVFNDPQHFVEGYDIQIARAVAEEMDAELEIHKVELNDLIPSLNRGDIDAIFSSMLDTAPRRQLIAFSDTYDPFMTEFCMAVLNTNPYAQSNSIQDFKGARVVSQEGAHLDDVIDQIEGVIHLPPAKTTTETVEMVINGEADGTVINYDTSRTYERKHRNLVVIRFPVGKGFSLDFSGACAGVRKNDKELLNEINDAVAGISRRKRQMMMGRTIIRESRATIY